MVNYPTNRHQGACLYNDYGAYRCAAVGPYVTSCGAGLDSLIFGPCDQHLRCARSVLQCPTERCRRNLYVRFLHDSSAAAEKADRDSLRLIGSQLIGYGLAGESLLVSLVVVQRG